MFFVSFRSEYNFIGKSIFLRGTNNAARSIGPRLAVLSIVVAAREHDVSISLMNLIQLLSYSDLFFSLVTGISISVTVLITVQSSLHRMAVCNISHSFNLLFDKLQTTLPSFVALLVYQREICLRKVPSDVTGFSREISVT